MITISSRGIDQFARQLERYPQQARKAASMAVNDTAAWSKTQARILMQSQILLPRETLENARFGVRQSATGANPEAVVSASNNPLGLSRFVVSPKVPGAAYPKTRIKVGGRTIQWGQEGQKGGSYAFLLQTPNGADGVALALRTTTPLRNSRAARKIGRNLYILSGPSVNQMFARIAPELVPRIEERLQGEFARQFARLLRD